MKWRSMSSFLFVCLLAVVSVGCSGAEQLDHSGGPAPTASASPTPSGEVQYSVPTGWVQETPASRMRKDQYRLPRAEGDVEDAQLVVFHFPGQGGTVQANVDRWIGQFTKADGSPVSDLAQVTKKEVNGVPITILQVSGTYHQSMGGPMAPRTAKKNYRLLGAIVDRPNGPWFFKLTGPEKTIARWEQSFQQFTASIKLE
ncbi:MAG: hypothetical protein ACE5JX_12500 [Acidobacteriota bacterium]